MLPDIEMLNEELEFDDEIQPSLTFGIDFENNRIINMIDEVDAVKQAIHLMISTERFQHEIFTDDYGRELNELIGSEIHYVLPEIERRVTEALMEDDRILSVGDFEFIRQGEEVTFITEIETVFGEIEYESEGMAI